MAKKYSNALKMENDVIAKETAIDFLLNYEEIKDRYKLTESLSDQDEVYSDYDFYLYDIKAKKHIYIEVERKKCWIKRGQWQGFPTADVPARKSKSKADLFIMCNRYCDTILAVRMPIVKKSRISYRDTIYTKNEAFLKVDLNECSFFHKINNSWNEL